MITSSIKENINIIKERIIKAEIKAGRKTDEVRLMAVSKFHPVEQIKEAINEGQLLFGENRVQEACEKFPEIIDSNNLVELHMIGKLQSNKVKNIVKIASCVQSIDNMTLLEEIEKQSAKIDKNIKILFEVRTGEDSKSGFTSESDLRLCLDVLGEGKFPHISPVGFMTMAPFTIEERLIRKSFITLRELADKLQSDYKCFNFTELSMGMSNDFEIAIEEGSTMVRVGTAIFGERDYNK